MFGYHIAMMVMFITGVVPVVYEIAIAGSIVLIIVLVSLRRRRELHWRWPRLGVADILKAIGVAAAIGVFLFVGSRNAPATDPHFLPWILAGAGIGLFGVLQQLKLVAASESEFIAMGKPGTGQAT